MNYTETELAHLCEKHKGLLVTIINNYKFKFPLDMYDWCDIEQLAWVGFLVGLKTYKPELGSSESSWIGKAITTRLGRELDYLHTQMRDIRIPRISMDAERGEDESGDPVTLYSSIADCKAIISEIPVLREQAEEHLSGRDLEVFHMKMGGYENIEIARHYGITRERVRQIWVNIENKLKKLWRI